MSAGLAGWPVWAIAIAFAVGAIIALWLARAWGRWRGSWRARRRADRAIAGEDRAAALLERAGFAVIERQARLAWSPRIDGQPVELELRADYVVEQGGARFVAEVKTGELAPRLETAATRRQLLEYSIAFDVDGVLLVCPEAGTIHRVEFPAARTRKLAS